MRFSLFASREAFSRAVTLAATLLCALPALAGGPDLIVRQSTDFKPLTADDKLATYGIDDPLVEGVVCYFTQHEKNGANGAPASAEDSSYVALACRQYGPVKFNGKFSQSEEAFGEKRSPLLKNMHVVRGCDAKRNLLVYMAFSDKLDEGDSPRTATSAIAIQPWSLGGVPRCASYLK